MLSTAPEFKTLWKQPVVKLGVITVLIPVILCFLPNIYLAVVHGAYPSLGEALKAWGMIAVVFGAFYIVEPMSYYPILGLSGTYISFVSGNISNMRIPCSAVAQEVAGTESGTLEAEIVSTLGISASVITNMIFLSIAAIAGGAILSVLPLPIQTAFNYCAPAIFGAMLGQFAIKMPILLIPALAIPLICFFGITAAGSRFFLNPSNGWVVVVLAVFGTIAFGRFLYVNGKKKAAAK